MQNRARRLTIATYLVNDKGLTGSSIITGEAFGPFPPCPAYCLRYYKNTGDRDCEKCQPLQICMPSWSIIRVLSPDPVMPNTVIAD